MVPWRSVVPIFLILSSTMAVDAQLLSCATSGEDPEIVYRLWNTERSKPIGKLPTEIDLCSLDGPPGLSIQVRGSNCNLDAVKFKLYDGDGTQIMKKRVGGTPPLVLGGFERRHGALDVHPVDELLVVGMYRLEINPTPGAKQSKYFNVSASCNSDAPSDSPTYQPSDSSSSSMSSRKVYKCFEDWEELRSAVNVYLEDNSPTTVVAGTYGWPIGVWCVSKVTQFHYLFSADTYWIGHYGHPGAATFNEDISSWDMSSAIELDYMFWKAKAFNRRIGRWNTSSVKSITGMFYEASRFNQDLDGWDTTSMKTMRYVFEQATSFNGDVTTWDVSNVDKMESIFRGASKFNQDISAWNVSMVSSAQHMLSEAESFNQDLCTWGNELTLDQWSVMDMFVGSGCLSEEDPVLDALPVGPLCVPCS